MAARPYRLCGAGEIAAAQGRIAAAVQAWADAWLGADAGATVDVQVSAVAAAPELSATGADAQWLRADGPAGSVWLSPVLATPLERLLFGSAGAGRTGLASGLVQEALEALATMVAGGGSCERVAAPRHLLEPGRGLVQVQAGWGGHGLPLLVELAEPARRPVAAAAPLGSVAQALGAQLVAVHATLGGAEIDLETLHLLRVGDVLRLDKRVDQGVDLAVAGQDLRCGGYLVSLDGAVGVELTRRSPSRPD